MKLSPLVVLVALLSACSSRESDTGPGVVAPTTATTTVMTPAATQPAPAAANGAGLTVTATPGKCDGTTPGAGGPAALTAAQSGADLRVELTKYQTYCDSDAKFSASDVGGTVHIVASKPSTVSKCSCTHGISFVVQGVKPGEHRVVFDETPYVGNDAPKTIATVSVTVK